MGHRWVGPPCVACLVSVDAAGGAPAPASASWTGAAAPGTVRALDRCPRAAPGAHLMPPLLCPCSTRANCTEIEEPDGEGRTVTEGRPTSTSLQPALGG